MSPIDCSVICSTRRVQRGQESLWSIHARAAMYPSVSKEAKDLHAKVAHTKTSNASAGSTSTKERSMKHSTVAEKFVIALQVEMK